MERLLTIMRKEIHHIWRDPRTLALILALPALLLILLGYGVSAERKKIPVAVADFSKSEASRTLIQRFTSSEDFELLYDAWSEDELLSLIDQDRVDVGILIPEDYGRLLDTQQTARVQFYINGSTDPTDVGTIQLKINAIIQMFSQEVLIEQIMRNPVGAGLRFPIESFSLTLYNPNSDPKLFMIPGLIAIILQVQTLLLTALAIVREREQGTMEQLIVTPIKSWELMLGKIIPYLVVTIFNLFALLFLGKVLFGVWVAGSFWELIGLSTVFILGSLGMGVLVSNLSQSQMQAIYLTLFVILIPAIILSGMLFPRDSMPLVTHLYGELLPITHYLEIIRAIMVRGISSSLLLSSSILSLIILSVVYFVASVLVFRKRL
jgi:ABC-2 type transport system permease protein